MNWQRHIEVVTAEQVSATADGWKVFEGGFGRARYRGEVKAGPVELLVADDGRLPLRRVVAIREPGGTWKLDKDALEDVAGWVSGSIIIVGLSIGVLGAAVALLTMLGLSAPWYAVMVGTAITLLAPPALSIPYGTDQARAVSRHLVGSMGGVET